MVRFWNGINFSTTEIEIYSTVQENNVSLIYLGLHELGDSCGLPGSVVVGRELAIAEDLQGGVTPGEKELKNDYHV